jgi:type IV secretory pathway component VirB8
MKRILMASALVVAFAAPSFAQTVGFYVVQDKTTKKCTIVDKKPETTTTTTTTVVGDTT